MNKNSFIIELSPIRAKLIICQTLCDLNATFSSVNIPYADFKNRMYILNEGLVANDDGVKLILEVLIKKKYIKFDNNIIHLNYPVMKLSAYTAKLERELEIKRINNII